MKNSGRQVESWMALAVVLLLVACSKPVDTQPVSSPAPVVAAKVSSASECRITSNEEMKTSLVQAVLWGVEPWSGPEGLVKKKWELSPDIWHLQNPVVITGKRLEGKERAEFLHYDETWIRRTNLVFQPPHTTTGYTWDSTGQRIYMVDRSGYTIYPAPGCWQFEARSGDKLLATLTQFKTYEGPEIRREVPPASSDHGGPVPEPPSRLSRANCPVSPQGRIPLNSVSSGGLNISLPSSPQPMVNTTTLTWHGPDKNEPISLVASKAESALEISGKSLTTKSKSWFELWEKPNSYFYYQKNLMLPLEPYKTEEEYKIWWVNALFPQPGCWQITVRGQTQERKVAVWLEPKPK